MKDLILLDEWPDFTIVRQIFIFEPIMSSLYAIILLNRGLYYLLDNPCN